MVPCPLPTDRLDARTLLAAYRMGVFPMAEHRNARDFSWYAGMERNGQIFRAHIPIGEMHISDSLRKALRRTSLSFSADENFEAVIRACADTTRRGQTGTWISETLMEGYCALFDAGIAHCIACHDEDGQIAGGLYGVQIGSIFCGESVFSLRRDVGKMALVHLAARLWRGGFSFLETQQVTNLTESLGGLWISLPEYLDILDSCWDDPADFRQTGISDREILDSYLAFRKANQ